MYRFYYYLFEHLDLAKVKTNEIWYQTNMKRLRKMNCFFVSVDTALLLISKETIFQKVPIQTFVILVPTC